MFRDVLRGDTMIDGKQRIVAPEQGEWVDIDKNFEIQCCDCGLIHGWELRVHKNKVQLRGWRLQDGRKSD